MLDGMGNAGKLGGSGTAEKSLWSLDRTALMLGGMIPLQTIFISSPLLALYCEVMNGLPTKEQTGVYSVPDGSRLVNKATVAAANGPLRHYSNTASVMGFQLVSPVGFKESAWLAGCVLVLFPAVGYFVTMPVTLPLGWLGARFALKMRCKRLYLTERCRSTIYSK